MSEKKVLLVDDEPIAMAGWAIALTHAGFTCLVAVDANAALDLYRTAQPHLVITDHHMPGMTGLDLIAEIRKSDRSLPIIMTSSNTSKSLRETARALGIYCFVVKPFTEETLVLVVKRALGDPAPG